MNKSALAEVWPLSPLQEGLLFHAQYDEHARDVYVGQHAVHLDGPLDPAVLRASWEALLRRHANLRAAFPRRRAGAPVQMIVRAPALPWREADLSDRPLPEAEAEADRLATEERARGFNLAAPPLLRLLLIRLDGTRYRLLVTMHHIVLDGWSLPILFQELSQVYAAGGDPSGLPPAASYRDYLAWLNRQDRDTARTAWADALTGVTEPTLLVPDGQDTPAPVLPHHLSTRTGPALAGRLRDTARTLGLTLNTLVQGAWGQLLGTLTGRTDVVFGATVAGRPAELPGVERMLGLFINTLPVRVTLDPARPLTDTLAEVQSRQSRLLAHQHLGLAEVQRAAGPGATFDTLIVYENFPGDPSEQRIPGGLDITQVGGDDASHYPLTLVVSPGDDMELRLDYRPGLFDEGAARGLLDRLVSVLDQFAADPRKRTGAVDLLSEVERRLVGEWNDTGRVVSGGSLVELFEAQVVRSPDAVAVVGQGVSWTYGELNARANGVAYGLMRRGVGCEDLVGVRLERSAGLIPVLLGVLKAGAAYVPLDVALPEGRLVSIAAGVSVVLTDADVFEPVVGNPGVRVLPGALAYVMYTSGSSGVPKGVAVTHRNVVAFCLDRAWAEDVVECVLFQANHAFDASTYEIWVPLLRGGRLVVASAGEVDAAERGVLIARHGVTNVHATAGLFRVLAEQAPEIFAGVREVSTGGDVVSASAIRTLLAAHPGLVVRSTYGPTETTAFVTQVPFSAGDEVPAAVPIGRPMDNTRTYVLDGALRLVPPGVVGELYVAGEGVARGYAGRPGLTAERFVASPFTDGRMYRTGDLARWSADGVLEFAGRADEQVKIRGFRIEPAEVEAVLSAHGSVRQAAVIAREDQPGVKRLVAYVVGGDESALREWAAERLPDYMVPAAFVTVDAIPLTRNGKLDRAALPAPDLAVRTTGRAPATPTEEVLCGLFAEVLGLDRVGADDSFFTLGGDSLLAMRLIARIRSVLDTEVGIRDLFTARTVAELGRLVRAGQTGSRAALLPGKRPQTLPLSYAQQRMWFLNRLEEAGAGAGYNVPLALRLSGDLDIAALEAALGDVADRHESLRTRYPHDEGVPRQEVLGGAEGRPRLRTDEIREEALRPVLGEELGRGFDLSRELPWRVRLLTVSSTESVLVVVAHHIAVDGWSMGLLLSDLRTAYAARVHGSAPNWAPLPVQYADYALWEREVLGGLDDSGSLLSGQLGHWRQTLTGLPDELPLPADRPRPAVASFRGGAVPVDVDARTHARLAALAQRGGATVFMVAQAALALLLARLGAGSDVPVGTVVAGRGDPATEDLVGCFLNTLVLRTDVSGDPSFTELLARVRDTDLAAYAHQDLPFELLVDELNPPRSLARHPLVQVVLNFQNIPRGDEPWQLPGVRVTAVPPDEGTAARFDLSVTLGERRDAQGAPAGLVGDIQYAADLFDEPTVHALAARLVRVLEQVAADPAATVGRIDILDDAERLRVIRRPAGQTVPETTLPELFEQWVARDPSATAVTCDGTTLTYTALDTRANRLAHELIARGIGPESRVAVLMERSLDLVTALLGIVKAGAAYVPVDPAYPAERIAYTLTDARPSLVVCTTTTTPAEPAGIATLVWDTPATAAALAARPATAPTDTDRRTPLRPAHPAYVIYTSGSTGRPKGVTIPHANVVRLLTETRQWFAFGPDDTWTLFHSYAFDFSVWEIWGALLHGGRLVVVPHETSRTPDRFLELLAAESVTVLNQTPSAFAQLMAADAGHPRDDLALRYVIFGGEPLEPGTLSDWYLRHPQPVLVNMYGITETTVHVTHQPLDAELCASRPGSVIGGPIPDLGVHVLDDWLRPVPPGVTGELYVSGRGLARGYLDRPGLTAERFVACPFTGGRMYRSGDLARYRADGTLEHLGRADHQIQLRGFRVEPGEIEATLTAHDQVGQAAVIAREESGTQRLVAYVVPRSGADPVEGADLRAFAAARLPEHMVPAAVVQLDALPVTVNGKLDRAALPAPDFAGLARGRAPRTPTEEVLCGLFGDVLGLARVGAGDSFFDLGGDSLLAMRLLARVRAALDTEVGIRELFAAPTVEALAHLAEEGHGTTRTALVARPRQDALPLSYAQQRMWLLNQLEEPDQSAAYNVSSALRLSGDLDVAALDAALGDLAERHESLRTVFPESDGAPRQEITGDRPPLRTESAAKTAVPQLVADETGRGFDLTVELPWRVRLLTVSPVESVLVIVAHHIAVDGVSMGVLAHDLGEAYAARSAGTAPAWEPLPVQYADYALWQREALGDLQDADSVISEQLGYWRTALAGIPEELPLPADRPRPSTSSFRGSAVSVEVDAEVHARLSEVARRHGVTMFMVVQAALAVLLSKVGAGTDIPLGTAVAGRGDAEVESMVGFFVNTLVLRTDVSGDPSFVELLGRVRETDLSAYAHQDVPFERLVEELNPARSLSRHPLFQVMLAVDDAEGQGEPWTLPGVDVAPMAGGATAVAKFDLSVHLEHRHEDGAAAGIAGVIQYADDLFDEATARGLADRFVRVLERVAGDPGVRVGDVEVLSEVERRLVVGEWNDTGRVVSGGSLVELFEAQVVRSPDAVAVVSGETRLTYGELNARANGVARVLMGRGVGRENLVGVRLERSAGLVPVLLGVLKAGAAYVPLDTAHPQERLASIVAEAGVSVVLTDADVFEPVDDNPGVRVSPEALAYVMYTSGSSGVPKGVAVTHRNVVAFCLDGAWTDDMVECVLFQANHAFDASTYEIWVPLLRGGRLVVAPAGDLDAAERGALIAAHGVTNVHATAGLFRVLAEQSPEIFAGVREVSTGGDVVSSSAIRNLLACHPDLVVRTTYGPTETTAFATQVPFTAGDEIPAAVPIGRPMDNTRAYVLDGALRLVPPGVVGELYLAGEGVARGYAGRPGLTAERFVACPFGEGQMYRTGDLARWSTDGVLEFAGRADEQVKIRGFRIEPAEVEAVLSAHGSVSQAAVIAREDQPGVKRLVAYVVGDVDEAELRRYVADRLPDYMVPSAFVTVDTIPLTRNGKLDRAALPAPDLAVRTTGRAPATLTEELLCGLFAEILGLDRVGADDSFFTLGGDSVMSILVVSRARRAGVVISARQVFEHRTPAALARVAGLAGEAAEQSEDVATGPVPLTPGMLEVKERSGAAALSGAFCQSTVVSTPADLTPERLEEALRTVMGRHDMLRATLVTPDDGAWTLEVPSATERISVPRIDAAGLDAEEFDRLVDARSWDAVAEIDAAAGSMLRAVWFDAGPDAPGRLLLVAHHLVMDGVSWRILLRDLVAAYEAPDTELARTGASFRRWARQLAAQAVGRRRVDELPEWQRLLAGPDPVLGSRPLDPRRDTVAAGTRRTARTLSESVTAALLDRIPADFQTGTDEVLLAGLVAAVAEWRRRRGAGTGGGLLVDIEDHGREPLTADLDVTGTVGWFTGSHPARLDTGAADFFGVRSGKAAVGLLIKRVREQLRAVPGDGLGFGLLRYLNPATAPVLAELPTARIGFNYVGRMVIDAPPGESGKPDSVTLWQPVGEAALGGAAEAGMAAMHELDAGALVRDQVAGSALDLTLTCPSGLFTEPELAELADGWAAMLTGIAAHVTDAAGPGHTPSDFALVSLEQDQIDEIAGQFLGESGQADPWSFGQAR
ncbi:amino acid adenylation domain-containing protein [Streptomyces sp. 4F14]|uniref:non-ribosomal peptide synthetase n=1 Tax=Streptomyces sp. 4F14 TaxID=3394380 RepID=UPI003A8BC655